MKNFDIWNEVKKKIDVGEHKPPFVSERDLWWVNVGENVGSEINGKSDIFSRPVIIFKKLSHGFYFVIPTTTKEKEGSWFVPFVHGGKNMCACLHQARVMDYKRLLNKLGKIDTNDYVSVQVGFEQLYLGNKNKYSPPKRGRD